MSFIPRLPASRRPDIFSGRRAFASPYHFLMVTAIIVVASAFTYRLALYPESNLMPFLGLAVVVAFIIWRPVLGVALFLLFYPMVPKSGTINLMKSAMLGLTLINVAVWAWQKMRMRDFVWMRREYIWIYVFLLYTGLSPFLGAMRGFTVMDWARDIAPFLNLLMVPVLAEYFGERKHRWLAWLAFIPPIFTVTMYSACYVGVYTGFGLPAVLFVYYISTFHFSALFCLGALMFMQAERYRYLWLYAALISVATIALTTTRTVWMSLIFAIALMLALSNRFRRMAVTAILIMVVMIGWIYLSPPPQFSTYKSYRKGTWIQVQRERIYGIKHKDISMLNRNVEFEQAKKLFVSSPFVGVGFGYWFTLWQYLVGGTGMSGFWTTNNLHNDVMFILVKGGIIGLLLFAMLLYSLTRKLYEIRERHRGTLRAILPTAAIVAVYNSLFVGSTTAVYQTREAIFFLTIILALGLSAFSWTEDSAGTRKKE